MNKLTFVAFFDSLFLDVSHNAAGSMAKSTMTSRYRTPVSTLTGYAADSPVVNQTYPPSALMS